MPWTHVGDDEGQERQDNRCAKARGSPLPRAVVYAIHRSPPPTNAAVAASRGSTSWSARGSTMTRGTTTAKRASQRAPATLGNAHARSGTLSEVRKTYTRPANMYTPQSRRTRATADAKVRELLTSTLRPPQATNDPRQARITTRDTVHRALSKLLPHPDGSVDPHVAHEAS